MRQVPDGKKKKIVKTVAILIVLATVFGLLFSYFRGKMVPVFVTTCSAEVDALSINAINAATKKVLFDKNISYDELFDIEKNNSGDITLIQARSVKINKIARELALETQKNIENNGRREIGVPIGTLTGITMFIGTGPDVNIKITPIGVANCDFVSEFVSAGINQTVHKIYVKVFVNATVALPVADLSVDTESEILICENLIIGKVPDTYLSLGRISTGLNLVP
ncbi:MAG: sporulation protein YunB [Eubacteriales bacterium]|nr:sporulation protein YunB [Christensenellaceae bacterium]MDD6360922.1 sporulation protein YunB [Christensenellaceae bacterium]MDY4709890.1 sporulation protein YunB [Eubacteriales bacterium]MDY6078772.1 sporulation protein YunB [Eubacteriales bacterium]